MSAVGVHQRHTSSESWTFFALTWVTLILATGTSVPATVLVVRLPAASKPCVAVPVSGLCRLVSSSKPLKP